MALRVLSLAPGMPGDKPTPHSRKANRMTPTNDPKKRPLLTPEQLRIIRQSLQVDRKDSQVKRESTPREQFENLFR